MYYEFFNKLSKNEWNLFWKRFLVKVVFRQVSELQVCHWIKYCTCGFRTPKQCFIAMVCDSKSYDIILWRVISVKLNIVFCVSLILICWLPNTIWCNGFLRMETHLTWSYKWINCKRISEHTCWIVDVRLARHIKFCTCNDSTLKLILVCESACECDCTAFIGRPVFPGFLKDF